MLGPASVLCKSPAKTLRVVVLLPLGKITHLALGRPLVEIYQWLSIAHYLYWLILKGAVSSSFLATVVFGRAFHTIDAILLDFRELERSGQFWYDLVQLKTFLT